MTQAIQKDDTHGYCRGCLHKVVNIYAIEPRCVEGPCVVQDTPDNEDVITARKSDWGPLLGPITYPRKPRGKGGVE